MNSLAGTKPWYQSRGIWGSIITLAAAAAGAFGYTMNEADQSQMLELIMAIMAGGGGLLALVGRIYAAKEITPRK